MFILSTIIIAIASVILAVYSLKKQKDLKDVTRVKKELLKKKVIYQRDSSV